MVRDVGRSAEVLAAGITEPGAPARVTAAAQERGRIDLPINNAGNARTRHLDDLPEADIQAMITLNLTAPILLSTFTAGEHDINTSLASRGSRHHRELIGSRPVGSATMCISAESYGTRSAGTGRYSPL